MSARRCLGPLCAALVLSISARSEAIGPARADVVYAQSQAWIPITLAASNPGAITVTLSGVSATCVDPVASRNLPPSEVCGGGAAAVDVVAHVFANDPATGELGVPLRCTSLSCPAQTLPTSFRGFSAVLLHGGPSAVGQVRGTITVSAGTSRLYGPQPFALSGNVALDLSGPPAGGVDVVSVLVPDGPVTLADGRRFSGNDANDFLGTDATEIWLLDDAFRVVGADLAQSGVGAAGLIRHAERTTAARWAVVRPWAPPPADVGVYVSGAAVPRADGQKSPTVGAGRMRALLNAWYSNATDTDGDGVSNELEGIYQLCDGEHAFAAGRACTTATAILRRNAYEVFMDPRDTDGDGISDGAEVLGSDVARGTPPGDLGECRAYSPEDVTDTDLTFPLWGFDPRHMDALIELDEQPLTANATQCSRTNRTDGCRTTGVLYPWLGAGALERPEVPLWRWHEEFAHLDAIRVNNPDGRPGIELHFDAAFEPELTNHGIRPHFTARDDAGAPVPGLLIYTPPGGSGSQCGCGIFSCADPRRGGYMHRGIGPQSAGGGHSTCDGLIDVALGNGYTNAHELGHHLGLDHGGPRAECFLPGGNPFGINARRNPDVLLNNKIAYISRMSYAYGEVPDIAFSMGERLYSPLPRLVDTVLGFPETDVFGGRSTSLVQFYTTEPTPGPSGCVGPACVEVDFSADGRYAGVVTGPVEAGTGGLYGRGRRVVAERPHYWCATEQRTTVLPSDMCCATGTFDRATGLCSVGGMMPTEPPLTWTMLGSATPVGTPAGGRLYTFFVDDENPESTRCTAGTPGCTPLTALAGRLRWAALDSFTSTRALAAARTPCLAADEDCSVVAAGRAPEGDVRTDGGTVAGMTGSSVLGTATIREAGGETVVLAWATRRSLRCAPGTTFCNNQWSPLEVRFAAAPTLESSGFATRGRTNAALFPPGRGAHISGVGMAAWAPADRGRPTRAFLVAREAGTNELFYAVCDPTSGCDEMQPLSGPDGTTVRSVTAIAAATDHPFGGTDPSLAVAYGVRGVRFGLPVGDLHTLRVQSVRGVLSIEDHETRNNLSGSTQADLEGAISVAFTQATRDTGSRMILDYEITDSGMGLVRFFSSLDTVWPASATGALQLRGYEDGPNSRQTFRIAIDFTSRVRTPVEANGPGAVFGLYLDDRPDVTGGDPRIRYLEDRVRATQSGRGAGGPYLQFRALTDPIPLDQHFDYEDVGTLSFGLCQALNGSSLGERGADLRAIGSRLGALRCPAADNWSRNSGLYVNRFTPCEYFPCERDDTLWAGRVAEVVTSPNLFFADGAPGVALGRVPAAPPAAPARCTAENPALGYLASPEKRPDEESPK